MEKYQPILRRLKAAAQEKGVRDKMTVEDDFLEEMERLERNHEERMRSADEKIHKAEAEMLKVEAEKHMMKEEIYRQQGKAVRLLLDLGLSKTEIATKLGLSEAEIQQY